MAGVSASRLAGSASKYQSVAWDLRQPGALEPRDEVRRSRVRHERPALLRVVAGEQPVERDVCEGRVAVPRLAVRERELRALDHGVHELRAACSRRRQVEAVEQRELLEQDRPLTPRPGLEDRPPFVAQARRRLERRLERGEIVGGEQSAVRAARAVRHLVLFAEGADRLRDEAAVPRVAGRLDLPVAIRRRGFCLLEDARVRVGETEAAEQRPRRRRRQPGLRRRGPVGSEGRLHRRDALGDARQDGVAVPRVADRRLEHVAKRGRSELEQRPQPGVERAGHAGGEQPGAGDEVEPQLAEALGRRRGRRRPLPAHDDHVVARGGVKNDREVAARPVQVRLDDLQHEPSGRRGVERVAACFEQPHACRGCQPVRGGDHPERAVELGSCGEARHSLKHARRMLSTDARIVSSVVTNS